MKTSIDILGQEIIVEYDITITAHGSPESGPSYYSGGEPAEPAEWEIEILGISPREQVLGRDVDLEMPKWLKSVIATHLYDRDDINGVAQQIDNARSYGPDGDRE